MRLASNAAPTRRSAHQALDVESMLAADADSAGGDTISLGSRPQDCGGRVSSRASARQCRRPSLVELPQFVYLRSFIANLLWFFGQRNDVGPR
jgi:hypothetical protein